MSARPGPTVVTVAVRSGEATVVIDGTRVRWRVRGGRKFPQIAWLCDACGTHPTPTCWHAAHAAAEVATYLLGLPAEVVHTPHEGAQQ